MSTIVSLFVPFLSIVLSVLHITASTLFCPLHCLSFTLRLLPLFVHCIVCPSHYGFYPFLSIVLSVLHITASTLFCPLYCLSFTLRLLPFLSIVWSVLHITASTLVVHCIVCPSHYGFYELYLPVLITRFICTPLFLLLYIFLVINKYMT